MEEVTVTVFDASCEIMDAAKMPLRVVASKEEDGEDGLDKDGTDHMAAALLGAWMGSAKEGMIISKMAACSRSTDATLRTESVLEIIR